MAFFHGIQVSEKQTQIVAPVQVDSAVQVVVGLAPVNMGNLSDPLAPQIAYSYEEAVEKMGMSADHLTYTICESIKLSFATYNVSPLIMINVLDPTKHKQQKNNRQRAAAGRQGTASGRGCAAAIGAADPDRGSTDRRGRLSAFL